MRLDHVLLRATDIEAMAHFLADVIGLQRGYRPPFPAPGVWLYSDDRPLVHLIEDRALRPGSGPVDHIALHGGCYEALVTALAQHGVQFEERDVPLTGERQVFVRGPDGLIVEMLFPLGASHSQAQPYGNAND